MAPLWGPFVTLGPLGSALRAFSLSLVRALLEVSTSRGSPRRSGVETLLLSKGPATLGYRSFLGNRSPERLGAPPD